jgi:hypothetical protein
VNTKNSTKTGTIKPVMSQSLKKPDAKFKIQNSKFKTKTLSTEDPYIKFFKDLLNIWILDFGFVSNFMLHDFVLRVY